MKIHEMEDALDPLLVKLNLIEKRLIAIENQLSDMLDEAGKKIWLKAKDVPVGTKVLFKADGGSANSGYVEAEVVAYSKYGDEIVIVENMDGVDWMNVNDVKVVE